MSNTPKEKAEESSESSLHRNIGKKPGAALNRIARQEFPGYVIIKEGVCSTTDRHGNGRRKRQAMQEAISAPMTFATLRHRRCWRPELTLPRSQLKWGMPPFRPQPRPMRTSLRAAKGVLPSPCRAWCSLVQKKGVRHKPNPLKFLVPRDRIELPTRGFSVPLPSTARVWSLTAGLLAAPQATRHIHDTHVLCGAQDAMSAFWGGRGSTRGKEALLPRQPKGPPSPSSHHPPPHALPCKKPPSRKGTAAFPTAQGRLFPEKTTSRGCCT